MQNNLRIDNPCPFRPTIWNQTENGNYCKGCRKNIVDMRGKSVEEIRSAMTSEFCGIFTSDQLPGQQRIKLSRRMIFNVMTLLSVIGFSVKPLNVSAKTSAIKLHTEISENTMGSSDDEPKEKNKKKTKKKRKNKKPYRTVGCPAF